jgi:tartronate-semialdehyde synthase
MIMVAKERKSAGTLPDYSTWVQDCAHRKQTMQRKTHFDEIPIKPQRVYEEMNRVFDRDTRYVSTIGLSQIAGGQFLHVYKARNWINCGQAGPLGWTVPATLGVVTADPRANVVALSGDYDFQFMIEELAVGAQFNLPYVHVVVNNSYLGLIRQAQRAFDMDFCVQLGFDNINSDDTIGQAKGYGVDHVKVAEGLGCKAIRVEEPGEIAPALHRARMLADEHRVPVVVEVILEKVTNIAMGTELDNVTEFEDLAERWEHAPTALMLLD